MVNVLYSALTSHPIPIAFVPNNFKAKNYGKRKSKLTIGSGKDSLIKGGYSDCWLKIERLQVISLFKYLNNTIMRFLHHILLIVIAILSAIGCGGYLQEKIGMTFLGGFTSAWWEDIVVAMFMVVLTAIILFGDNKKRI